MNSRYKIIFRTIFVLLYAVTIHSFGQHTEQGYHGQGQAQNQQENLDMPGVCQQLATLVRHHAHEEAHALIYETIAENPSQPDCFYYNARLYFSHKLSGSHSKPLFDSLMTLYEYWFSSSRHPIEVLNWKGRDLREFYNNRPDSLRKYCAMYKRIYDADKNSMHPYNLKVLAFCACDLHGKIDIDSLWSFTKHQSEKHQEMLWKASYKSLKRELIACPRVSCDKLHELLHPTLHSKKEGPNESHQISTLLAKRGCKASETGALIAHTAPTPRKEEPKTAPSTPAPEQAKTDDFPTIEPQSLNPSVNQPVPETKAEPTPTDDPFAVSGTQKTQDEDNMVLTSFDVMYKKAKGLLKNQAYKEAMKEFEEAMKASSTPIEKADCYLGMAVASDSLKDYPNAKMFGLQVHQTLPDEIEGLRFLEQLYKKGEVVCGFHTPKEMAGYYILLSALAWELGNSEESDGWKSNANLPELYKSGQAKQGEKVKVGCFFNEEVTLP
jgi:TolA-binding protein